MLSEIHWCTLKIITKKISLLLILRTIFPWKDMINLCPGIPMLYSNPPYLKTACHLWQNSHFFFFLAMNTMTRKKLFCVWVKDKRIVKVTCNHLTILFPAQRIILQSFDNSFHAQWKFSVKKGELFLPPFGVSIYSCSYTISGEKSPSSLALIHVGWACWELPTL